MAPACRASGMISQNASSMNAFGYGAISARKSPSQHRLSAEPMSIKRSHLVGSVERSIPVIDRSRDSSQTKMGPDGRGVRTQAARSRSNPISYHQGRSAHDRQ